MTLPKTEFRVNGRDYVTELMPAREALVMLPKIVALLGRPTTTLLLSTPEAELQEAFEDRDALGGILHEICTNAVEQGNGLLLLHELMRRTTCKQVQVSSGVMELPLYEAFDAHFAGELTELFTVAMHVARASFTKPSAAK